jgi:hypothetical protein
MCIYDRESESLEPVAFKILHREEANKVFWKYLHAIARVILTTDIVVNLAALSTLLAPTSSMSMSD